jgi:hypothetical protein
MTSIDYWIYFFNIVEEAPVMSEHDEDIHTEVGGSVVLSCSARGSPQPQISWFKNG